MISARARYEEKFPHHDVLWKVFAFQDVINEGQIESDILTNLISIGDSDIEVAAVYDLAARFENYFLKIVKLKEEPKTPEDLTKELK